jgi:coenzyme F420 hydrogenase subunit delta
MITIENDYSYPDSLLPEYCRARTLVLGVGNPLFGDDGFGPAVARHLNDAESVPEGVLVMDVGTSTQDILFNILLSETRPERIIIVDATDVGREPGELFELEVEAVPQNKSGDFSVHLFPSTNMLKELRDECGVEVVIISAQVEWIPTDACVDLSQRLRNAVPCAARMVLRLCSAAGQAAGGK